MGRKNVKARKKSKSASLGQWIMASRPLTLVISLAAVAMGWGAATLTIVGRKSSWVLILLAALAAVFLQIAANFINDYGDGKRGADAHRVKGSYAGARLTGAGRVRPGAVLTVGLVFLALAGAAGAAAIYLTSNYLLLAVGVFAAVAAFAYTAGPFPYGYYGLGEVVVFLLFGPVAVAGTTYLLLGFVTQVSLFSGAVMGCWAAAILLINNLRDYRKDKEAGKRTIVVMLGTIFGRILCIILLTVPYIIAGVLTVFIPLIAYVFLSLLFTVPLMIILAFAMSPREYMIAFKLALPALISFTVFYVLGLYI